MAKKWGRLPAYLGIRLSVGEMARLRERAAADGVSCSDVARKAVALYLAGAYDATPSPSSVAQAHPFTVILPATGTAP